MWIWLGLKIQNADFARRTAKSLKLFQSEDPCITGGVGPLLILQSDADVTSLHRPRQIHVENFGSASEVLCIDYIMRGVENAGGGMRDISLQATRRNRPDAVQRPRLPKVHFKITIHGSRRAAQSGRDDFRPKVPIVYVRGRQETIIRTRHVRHRRLRVVT